MQNCREKYTLPSRTKNETAPKSPKTKGVVLKNEGLLFRKRRASFSKTNAFLFHPIQTRLIIRQLQFPPFGANFPPHAAAKNAGNMHPEAFYATNSPVKFSTKLLLCYFYEVHFSHLSNVRKKGL